MVRFQQFVDKFHPITNAGGLWSVEADTMPSYLSDGFVVSLSGKLKWADTSIPFGAAVGSSNGVTGYIGTLPEEVRPRYNSVFVVTNDKGLTCSVQIAADTGYLRLSAWSWPLIYFRTNEYVYSYVSDLGFVGNENMSMWQTGEISIKEYSIATEVLTVTQLSDFFEINLDGIVYSLSHESGSAAHAPKTPELPRIYGEGNAYDTGHQTIIDFVESLPVYGGILLILAFITWFAIVISVANHAISCCVSMRSQKVKYSRVAGQDLEFSDTATE